MQILLRFFVALCLAQTLPLHAEEALPASKEFAPPQGQGPVVVLVSGQTGPSNYTELALGLAAAGFDVVLVDGNDFHIKGGVGEPLLQGIIKQAGQSPHARPGKVGVLGASLGGAAALTYATRWPEQVAAVVLHYPATRFIQHPDRFVARIRVPTLMLAGTFDTYHSCCLIETARSLDQAARSGAAPELFMLHEYPGVDHGFSTNGSKRRDAAADALQRSVAHFRKYLGGG